MSYLLAIITLCTSIYFYIENRKLKKRLIQEKAKENFFANLVHDLKTPTSAQIHSLNQLSNGCYGELNEVQKEIISLTNDSCKYMAELINSIMVNFSNKIELLKLKKSNFDVVGLVTDSITSMEMLAQKNELNIEMFSPEKVIILYADELQVKRVILNLLSNAIKYSYKNTTIKISIEKQMNNLKISVENMSKHIPKFELDTIFEKYHRTKFSTFNNASTGLGLYLSKQLVLKHGGKIYAKSFEDGRCVFGFTLPILKARELESKLRNIEIHWFTVVVD